jgi:putative inorganic carbon (hco3(-)) transporter
MNSFGFVTIALYVFIFLWRPQDFIPAILNSPILFGLECLGLICLFFSKKNLSSIQLKYLLFYFFFLAISTVLSWGTGLGIPLVFEFFYLPILLFVLISESLITISRQEILFWLYIFGTTIMSFHTLDQVSDPNHTGWTGIQMLRRNDSAEELWQPRYVGVFEDPNDLGLTLVSAIPFQFYFLNKAKGAFKKFIPLSLICLHLYTIYLINSRGTILGVLAMAGIYGTLRYGGLKTLIRILIVLPFAAIITPSRLYTSGDDSTEGRINAWYEGTQMFLSNPILGVGKGMFLDYHNLTAHNSWVLIFAELGFPAYYFWNAFLFSSLLIAFACQKKFEETPLPPESEAAYNQERNIALALFYSLIGTFTCAFFISRSYMAIIYILPAFAVAQYFRFRVNFKSIKFKNHSLGLLGLSVAIFLTINIIIRLNT